MKRGRKYAEAVKKFQGGEYFPLEKAVEVAKSLSFVKFDETLDIALNLNVDTNKHSIRDTLVLPHRFGKEQRILVFAKGEKADEAKEAGATYVGDSDLVEKIRGGWLDFDVAIATPDMMRDVGKLGPILGRRGLMPNPKAQTVTNNVASAMAELKKGRVEFRADKTGVVHMAVGKISMEPDKILENAQVVLQEITRKRPPEVKGEFIKSVTLSPTMGPGVKVAIK